jgi:N-acetyl sugar amidotransferase
MIRTCARCLYTEAHPLHLTLDEGWICSGCRVHEEKDQLDWNERFARLREIMEAYRGRSGRAYDCIVPVSGARDSYFVVNVVKNRLGLNPQLVSYNKHYNTDLGIRNLANLRAAFDCDLLQNTTSPATAKAVTRASLEAMGSIYWHILAGQTAYPVQTAVRMRIPLIIWGVHQGVDQVGMFSHLDEVEMNRRYRKEHDLMGWEEGELAREFPELAPFNLNAYCYPDDREIADVGVRGIYLSNFIRWDSKGQHERMIDEFAYETGPQLRTFDTYNDVDCFHYSGLHDVIKQKKHGYGKALDHACREIRLRRLTREAGAALVEKYRTVKPADLALFCEWLGIDEAGVWAAVDRHRKLASESTSEPPRDLIDAARLDVRDGCTFRLTASKAPHRTDDHYVLIGKGHVDQRSIPLAG